MLVYANIYIIPDDKLRDKLAKGVNLTKNYRPIRQLYFRYKGDYPTLYENKSSEAQAEMRLDGYTGTSPQQNWDKEKKREISGPQHHGMSMSPSLPDYILVASPI